MAATMLTGLLRRLQAVPRSTRDWILDGIGSPAAPLLWFARLEPPGRWARRGVAAAKWTALIVWAVGFVWVWFPVFAAMLFWETFAPRE